jgi:hypothetical protein
MPRRLPAHPLPGTMISRCSSEIDRTQPRQFANSVKERLSIFNDYLSQRSRREGVSYPEFLRLSRNRMVRLEEGLRRVKRIDSAPGCKRLVAHEPVDSRGTRALPKTASSIEILDLFPRPRRASQKLEARGYAWIVGETADRDVIGHPFPADVIDQLFQDRFQRDAVEGVGRSHGRERNHQTNGCVKRGGEAGVVAV